MSDKKSELNLFKMLPLCAKEAEKLDIIFACDGAANVGQIGHQVAVKLTKEHENARMCCITAVAAESKTHVDVARRARKLIVINGCANRCTSNILKKLGIPYTYEIVIANEGVNKISTLDIDKNDVNRISEKIVNEVIKK